ncbi:unnamed protein product, partial [Ectocarpus sp. 12 AP-2014]
ETRRKYRARVSEVEAAFAQLAGDNRRLKARLAQLTTAGGSGSGGSVGESPPRRRYSGDEYGGERRQAARQWSRPSREEPSRTKVSLPSSASAVSYPYSSTPAAAGLAVSGSTAAGRGRAARGGGRGDTGTATATAGGRQRSTAGAAGATLNG